MTPLRLARDTMKPALHQPAVPLPGWQFDWRLKHELDFLRGLGHWRFRENVGDRRQLLCGYLEGLALRRRWAGLQREPLECEARLLLKKMGAAA